MGHTTQNSWTNKKIFFSGVDFVICRFSTLLRKNAPKLWGCTALLFRALFKSFCRFLIGFGYDCIIPKHWYSSFEASALLTWISVLSRFCFEMLKFSFLFSCQTETCRFCAKPDWYSKISLRLRLHNEMRQRSSLIKVYTYCLFMSPSFLLDQKS